MFDPDELALIKQQYDAFTASMPKPKPKKKGGRGGTLTSFISEGGAIGGGAAGAAAGTALLPGIGTLLGGALGAGIGAFGGRVAENKVRDDRFGIGDAAKEGAISSILGGGPVRLLKAGAATVKGVKGGAKLEDALLDAGNKVVGMSATRAAGNRLSKAGEGLIAKEFRLNPTQQANFKKLHGEEAVSVLRRYGIKKPEEITAKIAPLQNAFDDVVDRIPPISKVELQSAMKEVYEPLLKSPVLTRQQLGQSLKAQADAVAKKYGAMIPAPEANALRSAFDDAVTYTQRGTNEFTVNKKSADAVRKLLQRKADEAGLQFEGKTFKDVGLELRKLRNLDDVVGKQAYLGTGSLPLNLPNLLGTGVGGATGGLPGALAGGLVTQAVNSTAGRRLAANTALKTGEKLASKATNPYGVKALTSRIAPVGLADALLGAQDQSSMGNSIENPAMMPSTTMTPTTVQNMGELSQVDANMSTGSSPFAPENLQASVQQIIANGGSVKDAAEFVSLAEALMNIQEAGQGSNKPLTASQATRAAAANNALRDIPMISDAIETGKLGGAKMLPGSGTQIGRRLLGTENLDAALFNIADNILRARTGAAAPEAEVRRFVETFLPSATDSVEAKRDKLARAIRELQGYVNPIEASADTLEDALLAQGAF
jgi:hypothetical protein